MKRIAVLTFAALSLSLVSIPSVAQNTADNTASAVQSGKFTKKRYTIHGDWKLEQKDGKTVISFSDSFKTKSGPDLKIFLSPTSVSDLKGKTVTQDGLKLGVLKSSKGEQSYILPEGINLSDYKSVVVHCEAFSVLWGGFDISE